MSDIRQLTERKQKLGAIARVAILGLPIFLSLSRVFKEWAKWLVNPYRALTPIYVFGLLFVFFSYRKTLHEIILLKLAQKNSEPALEADEQSTVNEIKSRQSRIDNVSWIKRNYWLLVGVFASAGVDLFLWSLAKEVGKATVLSVIFAVFAACVLFIIYLRREHFSSREKIILGLIREGR